jgi:NAD-dependent deacetylase
MKVCSSRNPDDLSCVELLPSPDTDTSIGDKAADGSQLRPYIVWFGEAVPLMDDAILALRDADMFIIIGTSLNVYPAASLLQYAPHTAEIYVIDPNTPDLGIYARRAHHIQKNASVGVPELVDQLLHN